VLLRAIAGDWLSFVGFKSSTRLSLIVLRYQNKLIPCISYVYLYLCMFAFFFFLTQYATPFDELWIGIFFLSQKVFTVILSTEVSSRMGGKQHLQSWNHYLKSTPGVVRIGDCNQSGKQCSVSASGSNSTDKRTSKWKHLLAHRTTLPTALAYLFYHIQTYYFPVYKASVGLLKLALNFTSSESLGFLSVFEWYPKHRSHLK